jgi:hypothetical protein
LLKMKDVLSLDIGPNQGHPIAVTADRTTLIHQTHSRQL